MRAHLWISGVLSDIEAYADSNCLDQLAHSMKDAKRAVETDLRNQKVDQAGSETTSTKDERAVNETLIDLCITQPSVSDEAVRRAAAKLAGR